MTGAPARRGFGSRVIEATIRGQLGGAVERRWAPSGLVVEVAVPLARVAAEAGTGGVVVPRRGAVATVRAARSCPRPVAGRMREGA